MLGKAKSLAGKATSAGGSERNGYYRQALDIIDRILATRGIGSGLAQEASKVKYTCEKHQTL